MKDLQKFLGKLDQVYPEKSETFKFFKSNLDSIYTLFVGDIVDFINQVELQKYRTDFTPVRLERDTEKYWQKQGVYVLPKYLTWDKSRKHIKEWKFFIESIVNYFKEFSIPVYIDSIDVDTVENNLFYLNNQKLVL